MLFLKIFDYDEKFHKKAKILLTKLLQLIW